MKAYPCGFRYADPARPACRRCGRRQRGDGRRAHGFAAGRGGGIRCIQTPMEEWRRRREEAEHAKEEGVVFRLCNPTEILGYHNRMTAATRNGFVTGIGASGWSLASRTRRDADARSRFPAEVHAGCGLALSWRSALLPIR